MNHFVASDDHRYWGEERRHRYESPNNPVVKTGKSDPITLTIQPTERKQFTFKPSKQDLFKKQIQETINILKTHHEHCTTKAKKINYRTGDRVNRFKINPI